MPTTYLGAPIYLPGGFGPLQTPTVIGARTVPEALWWDGTTKQWQMDGDQWSSVHPVDQAMMLGCCFRLGSIPSAPDIGNTVFEINSLGSPNIRDDVEARIRIANPVARMITEGKAVIDSVDTEVQAGGRLLVQVAYFNLVTDPRKLSRKTLPVTI